VRKLRVYGGELFGFELSVFENVSSRKNISVPRQKKVNDIGTEQTAYIEPPDQQENYESIIMRGY
jgi:hypothetical protein